MTALPSPPPTSGAAPTQTSVTGIISLITGILAWLSLPVTIFLPFAFCCSGVIGIVAVATGHISLNEVARSAGSVTGRGLAIAGLVLGYAMLFATVVVPLCAIAVIVILALLGPAIGDVFSNIVPNI